MPCFPRIGFHQRILSRWFSETWHGTWSSKVRNGPIKQSQKRIRVGHGLETVGLYVCVCVGDRMQIALK